MKYLILSLILFLGCTQKPDQSEVIFDLENGFFLSKSDTCQNLLIYEHQIQNDTHQFLYCGEEFLEVEIKGWEDE